METNKKEVWHQVYHHGRIVRSEGKYLVVDFDEAGEIHILPDFCEEYRTEQSRNDLEIKDERFSLGAWGQKEKRNILIIHNENVHANRNRVLGIDIFTGKVVIIVDTEGEKEGLHSCSDQIEKLAADTVVQAECELCRGRFLNAIRIIGEPRLLGRSSVKFLRRKYHDCDTKIDCVCKLSDAKELCEQFPSMIGYVLVEDLKDQAKLGTELYNLYLGVLCEVKSCC